jgi:hypothetical protein
VEVLGRGRSLDYLEEDRQARRHGAGKHGHRRPPTRPPKRVGQPAGAAKAAAADPPSVFDFLNRRLTVGVTASVPATAPAAMAGVGAAAKATGAEARAFRPTPTATVHVQLVEVGHERARVQAEYTRLKAAHARHGSDPAVQRTLADKLSTLHAEHRRLHALERQLETKRDGAKTRRTMLEF